jgi:hypothetical protein
MKMVYALSGKNQIIDCKIGICCFLAKHKVFRSKSNDWLAWNQDNVWRDMSTH